MFLRVAKGPLISTRKLFAKERRTREPALTLLQTTLARGRGGLLALDSSIQLILDKGSFQTRDVWFFTLFVSEVVFE